jgi:hypothetical protein
MEVAVVIHAEQLRHRAMDIENSLQSEARTTAVKLVLSPFDEAYPVLFVNML